MSQLGFGGDRLEQIRRTLNAWERCARRGPNTDLGALQTWSLANPIAKEHRGNGPAMRTIERCIDFNGPHLVIRKMDARPEIGNPLKNELVIASAYERLHLADSRSALQMPHMKVLVQRPAIGIEQAFAGIDLQDLAELLGRGDASQLADARLHLAVWLGVLEALNSLHELGWVHCDARPDNFCVPVLGWDGATLLFNLRQINVIDFGLTLLATAQRLEQRENFESIRGGGEFPCGNGQYLPKSYHAAFQQAFERSATPVGTQDQWSKVDVLDRRVDWETIAFFVKQIYCDEVKWQPDLVPFPRFKPELASLRDEALKGRALKSLRDLPGLLQQACRSGDALGEKFVEIREKLRNDLGDFDPVLSVAVGTSNANEQQVDIEPQSMPPSSPRSTKPVGALVGGLVAASVVAAGVALFVGKVDSPVRQSQPTVELAKTPDNRSPPQSQVRSPPSVPWRTQTALIEACSSSKGEFYRSLIEHRRPDADKLRASLGACDRLLLLVPDDERACKARIGLLRAQLERDLGDYGHALQILGTSTALAPGAYEPHLVAATVYALQQLPDKTFAELARAREKGWTNLLEVDAAELPYLRPYRKDARYIRLKAELGPNPSNGNPDRSLKCT